MNAVEPIIPRFIWEECQEQKKKNQRSYTRNRTYLFHGKLLCPKCKLPLRCKGSGGRKKEYMYYHCTTCHFNIREKYVEKHLLNLLYDISEFDYNYKKYYLPLLADKDTKEFNITLETEIEELEKQKDRIKKAYLAGVVDIKDFELDLKNINEKLDLLVNKKTENTQICDMQKFSPEKIVATIDKSRVWTTTTDLDFFKHEWELKTLEEKQSFISRYIYSITYDKDKDCKDGIRLVNISFKQSYLENIGKLGSLGVSEISIPMIVNDKSESVKLNMPMTKKQLEEYKKEIEKDSELELHYSVNRMINDKYVDYEFNVDKNEKLYKVIPVKENTKLKNMQNKELELGMVISKLSTIE